MTHQWNAGGTPDNDTVTVMLAGPQQRVDLWLTQISADDRFRVSMTAATEQDFAVKARNPVAIIGLPGRYIYV
jgi:hypothetical protein